MPRGTSLAVLTREMRVYPSVLGLLAAAILAVSPPALAAGDVQVQHLYELSDFSGTIPYSDAVIHVDRGRDEVYVTDGGMVRIFNGAGMEIYRFLKDWTTGTIFGLAAEPSGDILLLLRDYTSHEAGPGWSLHRVDYRGRPLGPVALRGLPDDLADFSPDRMVLRGEEIFLVSSFQLRVVVVGTDGGFRRSHDLAALLDIDDPASKDLFGFALDRDGNMLFTIPVLFRVFVVSPREDIRQFGTPGSAPGKFGIVSGVAGDDAGNYIVADKLRNVVMIFDPAFQLITEIGFEGGRMNLVRPTDLALGNTGRIYITQARNQGVSVYSVKPLVGDLAGEPVRDEKGGASTTAVRHGGAGDAPARTITGTVPRDPQMSPNDLPHGVG